MKLIGAIAGLVILFPFASFSQSISGTIKDDQGKSLAGASVTLKKTTDSSVVKIAVSGNSGVYEFLAIAPGRYFINASFVGYGIQNSTAFDHSETTRIPAIVLYKIDGDLKAVTVTATRPIVEVKADKTVLNVEGTINAVGQDALELLKKSPGVLVDRDDNLSLSGKNGVQVYIDGKPSPLSGKDLADYLRTLQSSSIESIEIISNPSARYDAAGNAGIINIRLKKNKAFGTNGSVNAGYGIGTYPKYNGGLSLNHRDARVNIFGNYTYSNMINENFMNFKRLQLDTVFDQRTIMTWKGKSHNVKAGFDYFLNSKQTIGVMMNGNFSKNDFNSFSTTDISYNPTNQYVKKLLADNKNRNTRDQSNFNINYRFADTLGRSLNIDADYGLFRIRTDQMQPNFYFDPSGIPTDTRIYNMVSPTDIDIYSAKADYEQNYKKGKLSVGAKVSYVKSMNDFKRYNVVEDVKDLDRDRSNDFKYTENINAGYINYNRPIKKVTLQLGFRVEQTIAKGTSHGQKFNGSEYAGYDSTFDRNYVNLFPSAAISFAKGKNNQFNITYSRRIDRPSYQDLNPFEFKLDEYTYMKGNTELTPQYTNSFGISHTYKYKLTTALNYSHVNDVFTQLIDTAEKSKSFISKKNLATQDIASINISYPLQLGWFTSFANLNMYYSHFKADFGTGRTIDLDVYAYNLFMQNSAKLGKGWTAEVGGWYSSPSIWQGTFKTKSIWSVDAGIQKAMMKGKGNLKVSVSDVFQTMRWSGLSDFAGQVLNSNGGWESRQFKVNFTYRFGNIQVKAARQRKTSLDDESQRVGGDGQGSGPGR
ncbi:MAG: TonB-dependent receptor [Chitinophagaceae bacterium]|nr:TonB-dependent receptor [Chitinophagaceae bacterium]